MSRRKFKAIFERKVPPLDNFSGQVEAWDELFREYVSLEPLSGREFIESQQVTGTNASRAKLHWSITASKLTTADRFKIARNEVVNTEDPAADANYRIFNMESIVNVGERNRELELMVVERG